MAPNRTAYELALEAWVSAVVGEDVAVRFSPADGPRSRKKTFVLVQAVRLETRGKPARIAMTDAWDGDDDVFTGRQDFAQRVRADLNVYGPDARSVAEQITHARWDRGLVPAAERLAIEKLGDWEDLSHLEGVDHRLRLSAELTFTWQHTRTYPVTRVIESAAPQTNFLQE